MTGSRIEQLYCTHCTYGTAALHRAQDARRDQVFEYSTRSGSIDQFRSHQVFQSIEQYVRFQLPGDTPAAEMVRLTAETAPWQRLAYFPAVAGQCVLVRSCYRQRDTRDRPGSYFAHVLLGSAAPTPQFSLLDGLRMWGAPLWVSADAPDLPFDLPKLSSLSELPGYGALINDAVLLAFLQTPADANWDVVVSPAVRQVIPRRWRTLDAAKRRKLLSDLLATVLALNIARGDRLIVAAEPALAALLFYGIARLVPFQAVVERLSFSTCQSHFENAVATLSAVSFFDPQTADLNPEAYRGAAVNTFNQKRGQLIRSHAAADALVDLFVQRGNTSEIERISQRAGQCGAAQLADYEEILAAHAAVPAWRRPASGDEPAMPASKAGRRYLQLSLLDEFAGWGPDSAEWRALAGSPRHARRLLALLAGAEGSPAILERLCDLIDDNELRGIVLDPQAPVELKTKLLQRRIERTGQWPWICADLWNGRLPAGVPADLPLQVCGSLPREKFMPVQQWLLDGLSRETPENAGDRYKNLLRVLMARCRQNEADRVLLTSAFQPPRYTEELGRAVLRDGQLAAELVTAFPEQSAQLGACAAGVLDQLWSQGRAFREHFQMIRTVQAVLPESHRSPWHAWVGVNDRLQQLAPLYATPPAWYDLTGRRTRGASIREAGEALARDAERALSGAEYNGKRGSAGKAETIQEIAKYVITEHLPADFGERLTSAMRNEGWESRKAELPPAEEPAAKNDDAAPAETPPAPRRRRRLLRTMLLLMLIAVALGAGFWFGGGIPWARANVIDPLYALLPKGGETPPAPDPSVEKKVEPKPEAGDPDKTDKPKGDKPKKGEPEPGDRSTPVVVTDADPPSNKPEGPTPSPKEEKPEQPKPNDTTVAVNPMPMPGTPQTVPKATDSQSKVLQYPNQKLGAHLTSVVVAESVPSAPLIGKAGPAEPLVRFKSGVDEIRVYGPVLSTIENSRPGQVAVEVSSEGKSVMLKLRTANSGETIPLLVVNYNDVPTLQRFAFMKSETEQRQATELIASCVLELRYADYSRYVTLSGPPAPHVLSHGDSTVPLPSFWKWLGQKSSTAVSIGDFESPALPSIYWFSSHGVGHDRVFPFRLHFGGGGASRDLEIALSDRQLDQIKLDLQPLDRIRGILRDSKIAEKLKEYGSDGNHHGHWREYQYFCERVGRPAMPPPPPDPQRVGKRPKDAPTEKAKKLDDIQKQIETHAKWKKEWEANRAPLLNELKAFSDPINNQVVTFGKISRDPFACYVASVIQPHWDTSGILRSGIVVPVLHVKVTD